jgi:transcriptional regulator with XRE-family HTH domain
MIKIGGVIRAAREANELTQAELSKRAGIAVRTIIDIEKNKRLPTFEVLYSIIRVLDIPADQIFRPDKVNYAPEQEQLIRAIRSYDERDRAVFMETAWAYVNAAKNTRGTKEAGDQ